MRFYYYYFSAGRTNKKKKNLEGWPWRPDSTLSTHTHTQSLSWIPLTCAGVTKGPNKKQIRFMFLRMAVNSLPGPPFFLVSLVRISLSEHFPLFPLPFLPSFFVLSSSLAVFDLFHISFATHRHGGEIVRVMQGAMGVV